ncbi:hypothetical protein RJ55_01212 [Drechmeria coniospora]|nr:hypothetical protein RJ55_01212 [Drechmeria coniospora]
MSDAPAAAKKGEGKKKFEVKKWNAVALWAWDIVVDNCAICRNHIMDLCQPGLGYERRVHGGMGHLQCEADPSRLLSRYLG